MQGAFYENDGHHENDKNDEDDSDSYKQGVECWVNGNHGNQANDENHGPRVQTMGSPRNVFRNTREKGPFAACKRTSENRKHEVKLRPPLPRP